MPSSPWLPSEHASTRLLSLLVTYLAFISDTKDIQHLPRRSLHSRIATLALQVVQSRISRTLEEPSLDRYLKIVLLHHRVFYSGRKRVRHATEGKYWLSPKLFAWLASIFCTFYIRAMQAHALPRSTIVVIPVLCSCRPADVSENYGVCRSN